MHNSVKTWVIFLTRLCCIQYTQLLYGHITIGFEISITAGEPCLFLVVSLVISELCQLVFYCENLIYPLPLDDCAPYRAHGTHGDPCWIYIISLTVYVMTFHDVQHRMMDCVSWYISPALSHVSSGLEYMGFPWFSHRSPVFLCYGGNQEVIPIAWSIHVILNGKAWWSKFDVW